MMKVHRPWAHLLCTGVAAILTVFFCSQVPAPAGENEPNAISWRSDYPSALDEARSRNRLLWIHFTAPWCPSCARMEQDSLSHPAVRAFAHQGFVPLKLRSDLNQELALRFELSGLPATVIVTPRREVVAVREGYLGPSELGKLLENSLSRQRARTKLATTGERKGHAAGPGTRPIQEPRPATWKETEVALSGYCPVSLISDRRLVQGQAEYTVTHEGRLYRLANLITFNQFRRDPERYVPANGGNCPVAHIDRRSTEAGDPRYGALFEGRLFLCASEADQQRLLREPARYATVDVAEQGYCPHCLTERRLLIRGDPRVELTREGRRYWFPDPSHREAFLAAAESSASRR
jgi:YHS domain-containing protein